MTGPKHPVGPRGATRMVKPGRIARPPKATRGKLSLKSMVARSVYWSLQNAQDAMMRDQQRQDDQAALLHEDIGPNWDHTVTALQTTDLSDGGSGQNAGSSLDPGGSVLPPTFLEAPQ